MLEILNGRDKFYQWDVGQKLIVDDSIIAVHYDNGTGDALVCGVYEYEGQRVADVPNIMLQTVWAIKCYAYCGECVRAEKVYEVEKRSRPDDYIYSETETIRYTSLYDALLELQQKQVDNMAAFSAELADLAAEHLTDMETVEKQLAATNKDVADNMTAMENKHNQDKAAVEQSIVDATNVILQATNNHFERVEADIASNEKTLEQHTARLDSVESDIEIHVNNIYKSINENTSQLTNHENRITNIEKNGGGTGGGDGASLPAGEPGQYLITNENGEIAWADKKYIRISYTQDANYSYVFSCNIDTLELYNILNNREIHNYVLELYDNDNNKYEYTHLVGGANGRIHLHFVRIHQYSNIATIRTVEIRITNKGVLSYYTSYNLTVPEIGLPPTIEKNYVLEGQGGVPVWVEKSESSSGGTGELSSPMFMLYDMEGQLTYGEDLTLGAVLDAYGDLAMFSVKALLLDVATETAYIMNVYKIDMTTYTFYFTDGAGKKIFINADTDTMGYEGG